MGGLLSLPQNSKATSDHCRTFQSESRKRMRMSVDCYDDHPRLIPSLPDEISLQIIVRLPRIHYLGMQLVSRSWKNAITSLELFQLRKVLRTTEEWLYLLIKFEDGDLFWHAYDPVANRWQRLPRMPVIVPGKESNKGLFGYHLRSVMGSSNRIAEIVRGWFGWKDVHDRRHLSGCAVGAVDGCLYVLGGFSSKALASNIVWRYNPRVNSWEEVSPMINDRAFCKTGSLNDKLYVAGGVCRDWGSFLPRRSVEVFDPCTGQWTQLPDMPFSNAMNLPAAFLADMLKPMAVGMAVYKGRLYVSQSLYSWPFFIDLGGEVFDPQLDSWSEMPTGMGDGWPARQAGTKLSAVVDGKIYALEPSSSLDCGVVKMYDDHEDTWKEVTPKVLLYEFAESESPYLLVGILGKLHVITKDNHGNVLLLRASFETVVCQSSASSSSSPNLDARTEEANFWRVSASKDFGESELVSCQILDV